MLAMQILGSLLLLYLGGEALVRGASQLGARIGISALAVGLTVVAYGTSTPELVVSLDAALGGLSDIAIGNVVGSNIANVALILGLSAVIRPLRVETKAVRLDTPLMLVVSLGLVAALANGRISRIEAGLSLLALFLFSWFTLRQVRKEPDSGCDPTPDVPRLPISLVFVVVGLGLLVAGGHYFVQAAVELASALGVSEAAIGLTVVAVGTSLPELSSSVVAAARGEGDLAVGNVIGSNIFNILGILGVTALISPLSQGGIGWLDLGLMVGVCVAVLPLLASGRTLGRGEGILLIGVFIAYTVHALAIV